MGLLFFFFFSFFFNNQVKCKHRMSANLFVLDRLEMNVLYFRHVSLLNFTKHSMNSMIQHRLLRLKYTELSKFKPVCSGLVKVADITDAVGVV